MLDTVKDIYIRISRAAMRAGRSPEEIRLVAVTKTVGPEQIMESLEVGVRDFGENRVQEAREKIARMKSLAPGAKTIWHLIGHLQKNKAGIAVELFDLIHSVDSLELAQTLNEKAAKLGKRQRVLIQVKLSDEVAKSGLPKEDLIELFREVGSMANLEVEGLMTIPPFFEDPERVRPYFRQLRHLRDEAQAMGFDIRELSMGMSNDFEVAIEEGATIVRVGTSIFGERRKGAK